jgi:hypothetical protein
MQYLTNKPFSVACSPGHLTDREYFIAVGALVFCPICDDYKAPKHECKANSVSPGN